MWCVGVCMLHTVQTTDKFPCMVLAWTIKSYPILYLSHYEWSTVTYPDTPQAMLTLTDPIRAM